jgi:hypothetical protein
MHAGHIPGAPELCKAFCMTARDSDRVVWFPSSRGLFERSIDPVERSAGASQVGRTDLGAGRTGSRTKWIVAGRHPLLHERAGDAPHALSREPHSWRPDTA